MSRKLTIYVGVPGSGKSYDAGLRVGVDSRNRIRVNRDDLRKMGHGGRLGTRRQEDMISAMQLGGVRGLLQGGHDVFIDDTNLYPEVRLKWRDLAAEEGAEFEVIDLTGVPLQLCLQRNAGRDGDARLREDIIVGMWDRWIAPMQGRTLAEYEPGLVVAP
jgi:predicted kinase